MENCIVKNCGVDLKVFVVNDFFFMDIFLVELLKFGLEVLIVFFGVFGNVLVMVVICWMGKKKK